MDDYFNNSELCSGWTYYGRMITSPLFYSNGTRYGVVNRYMDVTTLASPRCGTENNRIVAHHLGLGGKLFRKAAYRLMVTFSSNFGRYSKSYAGESPAGKPWGSVQETPLNQVSLGFNGEIPGEILKLSSLSFTYGLYSDVGEVLERQFGATLGLKINLL